MVATTVILYIIAGTILCAFVHKRTTRRPLRAKTILGYSILVTMSYVLFTVVAYYAGINV